MMTGMKMSDSHLKILGNISSLNVQVWYVESQNALHFVQLPGIIVNEKY